MTRTHNRFGRISALALSTAALTLTACAGGGAAYQPIVDGPMGAQYSADLSDCRQVAERREYGNSDTQTSALVGAGLGGLVGLADAYDPNVEDFIGGAIVGALFGGGQGALETRGQRKSILLNCMAGRGHRIVG